MKPILRKVIALNFAPKALDAQKIDVVQGNNIFTSKCGDPGEEDSVYMNPGSFAAIFGEPRSKSNKAKQRLAVVKIQSPLTKRVIYRKYVFYQAFSGLDQNSLALNPASIRELGDNSQIVGSDVWVSPGGSFLYYWNHPFHATRVSTKLGVASILLAFISIVFSILA